VRVVILDAVTDDHHYDGPGYPELRRIHMEYTRLGQTDLYVSRICFGTWSFGGEWGPVQAEQSIAAVRKAFDLGINFFDTAQGYGFGASESLLGEALRTELKTRRRGVVLATKGGLRRVGDHTVRDSSPAWLRLGLESSLRALGTDYVDLYQIHWPDPGTPFEETAIALDGFVREGKIRYIGVSNFDASQMASFEMTRKIDTLQPPYHLFSRDVEERILPYCEQHSIGVLAYGPLAHGLLTGKFTPESIFRADDWRSKSPLFQGERFRRNLEIVDELKLLATQRGVPLGQLAIAWTLANPAVDVAIVGARTPEQIEQTAPAADVHLDTENLGEIERVMRQAVPVAGPSPETV
jgi:aryl-alcohol dehydrogenase-like predicted oxidoreductase